MDYYQLGGFGAAISIHGGHYGQHRDLFTPLQRHLGRPDGYIELVLGIKPSGSSHLLLTLEEAKHFEPPKFLSKKPSRSMDFLSLSPIVFRNPKQLDEKLENLKSKSGGRDTSKLNKAYEGQSLGIERSRVESTRVFYRILQSRLTNGPRFDERKYNIGNTSWAPSIRVVTFCANTWLKDGRHPNERKAQPRVLDVGWSEASLPDMGDKQNSYCHIQFKNNSNLGSSTAFQYGHSEMCSPSEIKEKVQQLFAQFSSTRPVVLVVHNWDTEHKVSVKDVLKSLEVNVDTWSLDLKELLWPPVRRYAPKDPRRPRSASPTPHNRSSRRPSPPPPTSSAPVYVVDVQEMYLKISGTQEWSDSVSNSNMRRRLGLYYDVEGFCAGNECPMLFEAFRYMAERGPIDDQKEEWPLPTANVSVPISLALAPEGGDDESDYGEDD